MIKKSVHAVGSTALLRLPSPTQEEYTTEAGIIVVHDINQRVEDAAQSGGTVVSVGPNLDLPIKAGDEVAIDYRVVSESETIGDKITYLNKIDFDGQELWTAKHRNLIAVKRGEQWEALGEHVILEAIKLTGRTTESGITVPDEEIRGKGTLVSGIDELKAGRVVIFEPNMSAVYKFPDRKEYLIVYKPYILGYE